MRRTDILLVATLVLHLVGAAAARTEPVDAQSLEELLAARRCDVAMRLSHIRAQPITFGDDGQPRNRFLTIAVDAKPDYYVQCLFFDADRQVICEAASGSWTSEDLRSQHFPLSQTGLATLRQLGFDGDGTSANYQLERDIDDHGVVGLADLMLTALHDAYEVKASTPLEFHGGYLDDYTPTCAPVG